MYKALVSFCGVVSMAKDETREIPDKNIAKDLLEAGYIKSVSTSKATSKRKNQRGNQKSKIGGE